MNLILRWGNKGIGRIWSNLTLICYCQTLRAVWYIKLFKLCLNCIFYLQSVTLWDHFKLTLCTSCFGRISNKRFFHFSVLKHKKHIFFIHRLRTIIGFTSYKPFCWWAQQKQTSDELYTQKQNKFKGSNFTYRHFHCWNSKRWSVCPGSADSQRIYQSVSGCDWLDSHHCFG